MPKTLKKSTNASGKVRVESESAGTNSKSEKAVINNSSKSQKNIPRGRDSSSDEMTQTERTHKTKKAVSNDSDRERDQILKIAPRSKSISKAKNSKGKKISFCLTNFARETIKSNQRSSSGVEVARASQMNLIVEDGVEFALAVDSLSGLIKIKPGGEKIAKLSRSELQFVVMQGNVECVFGDLKQKYSLGSTVIIPKGIKYGLRNPGKSECLLQYQAF